MRAASGGATALGVDYGMNRTGIAVSAGGIAPRPLDVVASKPIDALVREVVHRALKERVDVIVVGLPVPPNMTAAQAAAARAEGGGKSQPLFSLPLTASVFAPGWTSRRSRLGVSETRMTWSRGSARTGSSASSRSTR